MTIDGEKRLDIPYYRIRDSTQGDRRRDNRDSPPDIPEGFSQKFTLPIPRGDRL